MRVVAKAILPKINISGDEYRSEIERKMRLKTKPEVRSLFKETVQGWDGPPYFRGTIANSKDYIRLSVKPTGENKQKWIWVSHGVGRHPIYPRKWPVLMYRPGYNASTSVGSLKSRASQRFGQIEFSTGIPDHPGIEARRFEEQIIKLYFPTFAKDMQRVIKMVTRNQWKSG